ncbi:hypothetical protein HHI36_014919 [Cryptolaemus montrouzieri]|uniref:C2H2-type domain-containing protein n=1 Tax=Cryptolaemus montrouzieri TaxID=559131 RepID=A0ABD2N446_9CUCU
MYSKLPLIIILGATGSGKTKLSLELAKQFGGEIIGADSMQVYRGLDIITAKVKKEEQLGIPHHLIDILDPHETFTVLEYRNQAVNIIDKLILQNKLPIIVGGTNYYIESILWNILVEEVDSNSKVIPLDYLGKDETLSSQLLHEKLKTLDPNMAKRLHPNNKRKILRSLEVLYQKGKRHSEILKEQHSSQGGSKTSGPLRYPNSVILWLQCDKKTLNERLNHRVDEMVQEGLIDELSNIHKQFSNCDYTKGIFQSIGFKEFHSYLMIEETKRNEEDGMKILQDCIERLKMVTRRYANKQVRWVRNRFLGRSDRSVPPVYNLDVTNVTEWKDNVSDRATEIVKSYISGTICHYEKLSRIETVSNPNADDETYTCELCNRIFVGTFQWKIHLKSNKHRKAIEQRKKVAKGSSGDL